MIRAYPVIEPQETIISFVMGNLGYDARPDTKGVSAVGFADKDGNLLAGFCYYSYVPANGTVEMAGFSLDRKWWNRAWAKIVTAIPFEQYGCDVMYGKHSEHNAPVRRMWLACGGQETLVPDLWRKGEAGVISVLTRENWHKSRLGGRKDG